MACPICRMNSAQSYFRAICQHNDEEFALAEAARRFQLEEYEIAYIKKNSPSHSDSAKSFQEQLPLVYDILNEIIQSLPEKYRPIVKIYIETGGNIIKTAHLIGNIDLSTMKSAVCIFNRRTREPSVRHRIERRLSATATKEGQNEPTD